MDTITRNNIFLTAWEETLEKTYFQDAIGSPIHFMFNLINGLYSENNIFSFFDEIQGEFAQIFSSNNTLLETILLKYWGKGNWNTL